MANNLFDISSFNFNDYSSIRSGTYRKLLNSYYSRVEGAKEKTQSNFSSKVTSKIDTENTNLKEVKASANALKLSSADLTSKGKASAFQKKEVENVDKETGEKTVTQEYDKEAIKKAVSEFVTNYNSVIENAGNSDSTKVMQKTINMINTTNAYKKSLENIGITIGSDNKLSIDSEKFEKANVESVKSLFNEANSFAGRVSQRATQISTEAGKEELTANVYNKKGKYSNFDYKDLINYYL